MTVRKENVMPAKSEGAIKNRIAYNVKRNKEKVKRYIIGFTKGLDDEIINYIDNQEKYSVYIKNLIREDMKKKKESTSK